MYVPPSLRNNKNSDNFSENNDDDDFSLVQSKNNRRRNNNQFLNNSKNLNNNNNFLSNPSNQNHSTSNPTNHNLPSNPTNHILPSNPTNHNLPSNNTTNLNKPVTATSSVWKNIVLSNNKDFEKNKKDDKPKEEVVVHYNEYHDHCWDVDERFSLFYGSNALNIMNDLENLIYDCDLPIYNGLMTGNSNHLLNFLLNNSIEGLDIIKEVNEYNYNLKKEYYMDTNDEDEFNNMNDSYKFNESNSKPKKK